MDSIATLQSQARKKLQIADHMVVMTYPLVKEPKLLAAAMDNVYEAVMTSLTSLLVRERQLKRIPHYAETYESKMHMFKSKIASMYEIPPSTFKFLSELRELVVLHRKSPVEFSRKDKYVICSDDYITRTLDVHKMKGFIEKAKIFLPDMERLTK